MKTKKINKIIVMFLTLVMMLGTMTPAFADNEGGGGGATGKQITGGGSGPQDAQPIVWRWWDRAYDRDNEEPVQGGYRDGKWIKSKDGKTPIDFWINLISEKVRAKGSRYAKDTYNKKIGNGKYTEKLFTEAAERACKNAIKRSGDPHATARIVAVAVTLLHDDETHSWWFGGHASSSGWAKYHNMLPRAGNKKELLPWKDDEHAWNNTIPKTDTNDVTGNETWAQYIYRIGYKDVGDAYYANGRRFIVLAVTDNEPTVAYEFSTSIKDLSNTGDGVKWNITEPGNVIVQDEILYKNLDKDSYKVSAQLVLSDKVALKEEPDVEDVDLPDDMDGATILDDPVSEDGVIAFHDKTISIDDEIDAYSNYSGGKFWAMLLGKDETTGEYSNDKVLSVQALNNPGDTTLEIEDQTLVAVYYKDTEPNSSEDPIVAFEYLTSNDNGSNQDPNPSTGDDDIPDVADGTIIASVTKVTPEAAFKTGSNQKDWQKGSFITLKGNNNGYIDVYKDGLYSSVDDFTKVYKAGIKAQIYDGNNLVVSLNDDLKTPEEATAIICPFGTLTYYPLTNNNLIKVDGSNKTDGESYYKLQEAYVWEAGAHISFTDAQKEYLRGLWTNNLGKDADNKIDGVGMSFNQILNHGIQNPKAIH